ncbi:sensor histidine kinase [Mucilaginibacter antarcticus]|uniref:histidine kinase n=1 Tax=Mucilaginibacter antarcticus TaxID=1855725 RepID=A0ABW5XP39_9SPHI
MSLFPLPQNEDERLVALQSYNIFDTAEERDFDALAALASAICQVPIALITFIDEKRQWFKAHHGTDITENMRELSFCTHLLASGDDLMIVPDATQDERFVQNPMVTGPTKIMFYAGVPLVNEDGHALGSLCMVDQQTHVLSPYQVDALKTLATQVMDKLELRRKVRLLEKTNQELVNSNMLIQKFATMAAHDIKNPLSSIQLTSQALKIRLEKLGEPSCTRLIDLNITSTKHLLKLIDEMLAYSQSPSLLLVNKQQFELHRVITRVVEMLSKPVNIAIVMPEGRHELFMSSVAFEQIMINLISNAIRYNDKAAGLIKIDYREDEQYYHFEVSDNGMGIAPEYHDKIFTNSFTLKITDRYNQKGTGIGLSTVKDLLTALNGDVSVKSVPGEGATFNFSIPK